MQSVSLSVCLARLSALPSAPSVRKFDLLEVWRGRKGWARAEGGRPLLSTSIMPSLNEIKTPCKDTRDIILRESGIPKV